MPDPFVVSGSSRLQSVMHAIEEGADVEFVSESQTREIHSGSMEKGNPSPTTKEGRDAEKSGVKEQLLTLFKNSASIEHQDRIAELFDEHMGGDKVLNQHAKQFVEAANNEGIGFSEMIGKTVKTTSAGMYSNMTGKVVGYTPGNEKPFSVEVDIPGTGETPGEDDTTTMSFKFDQLMMISEDKREAAIQSTATNFEKGELVGEINDVNAMNEVMNQVAPDSWILSGSCAIKVWAEHLNVEGARVPNDIDLIVEDEAFLNTRFQLNQAFDANFDSGTSITFKNAGNFEVDVTSSKRGFGGSDDREMIGDIPVLSLNKLLSLKNAYLKVLNNASTERQDKEKIQNTINDITLLKKMIDIQES